MFEKLWREQGLSQKEVPDSQLTLRLVLFQRCTECAVCLVMETGSKGAWAVSPHWHLLQFMLGSSSGLADEADKRDKPLWYPLCGKDSAGYLFDLFLMIPAIYEIIINPLLEMEMWYLREVKWLIQSHAANLGSQLRCSPVRLHSGNTLLSSRWRRCSILKKCTSQRRRIQNLPSQPTV
jgi:hypothetical protein